jgi:hypothetical protein
VIERAAASAAGTSLIWIGPSPLLPSRSQPVGCAEEATLASRGAVASAATSSYQDRLTLYEGDVFALKVARAQTRFRSKLIQHEIAEGIEMDEHLGIVFRSGRRGVAPLWWSALGHLGARGRSPQLRGQCSELRIGSTSRRTGSRRR